MNNKYLLDKVGSDSEIEMLEKALATYRIKPLAPALRRATYMRAESPFPSLRFSLFYASVVSAFAVVVIFAITAIAWLDIDPRVETEASIVEFVSPPSAEEDLVALDPPSKSTNSDRVEIRQRKSKPQIVQRAGHRKPFAAKASRQKHLAESVLTAEEKYAYDQVRLALWITGSKLKLVPDTINRSHETDDPGTDKQ